MKYFICEGDTEDGKYNATSKAREDVENILSNMSFNSFSIPTINCVEKSKIRKIFQYFGYIKNYFIWIKSIKNFKSQDTVLIQYPIIYTTFFFTNILKRLSKKNIKTIAVIHDLESIRLSNAKGMRKIRANYEDKNILKLFDNIISHNEKMTNELLKYGVKEEKIVNLEVFDYLYNDDIDPIKRKFNKPVIIAGNLSSEKAYYLKKLNTIKNVKFNLYGKGIDFELSNNLEYKGCFLPSEIPQVLDGSFGLVWDGEDINDIKGPYGNYMKYNNPHKISLYLASELPVIVCSKSALANFVIEKGIGLAVDSIKDLEVKLKDIDSVNYNKMLNSVKKISKKVRKGYFLTRSIKKVLK